MNIHDIQRVKSTFPFLASVEADKLSNPNISIVAVNSKSAHFMAGHQFHHAILVLRGCVRIYKIGENGREITLYRVRDGGICELLVLSILGDIEYEVCASVETDTEALLVPIEIFKSWMDEHRPIRQHIYRVLTSKIISVTSLIEEITFKKIDVRIAEFLMKHCLESLTTLNITHEQMAVELGTAREVVSRTLKGFEKEGIFTLKRGQIHDIDRHRLESKLAELLDREHL